MRFPSRSKTEKHMAGRTERQYGELARLIAQRVSPGSTREQRMQIVVDVLWDGLSASGVSWVGFYLKSPDSDEMILGPRRNKPACSPIGLHGVCGRCWREGRPIVVRDVCELGDDYIACDPRDRSEIVIPAGDAGGVVWGVLDLDSFEVCGFNGSDVKGLQTVIDAAFEKPP